MKTDLYTKTVLTVIAIALSAIAFQTVNFVSTATASTAATSQPTAIKNETVDVNISHIGGVPITTNDNNREPILYRKSISIYDGIPVKIQKNSDK
ncbi:hypothetical protein G7050_11880 [Dysgonomonas sp. HDW5A]|uniref:hypothetical protein n=1 Tax=Dysgonomonas sp. HDW5A TaxID=2714926 RepID=UPI00140CD99E|nr:hypothetical protein [Dysgonomonas sp. HDW5A]QIK60488.1 hypothetical protein G7050_11880 [Dysgonomonas sp. HDW5A]